MKRTGRYLNVSIHTNNFIVLLISVINEIQHYYINLLMSTFQIYIRNIMLIILTLTVQFSSQTFSKQSMIRHFSCIEHYKVFYSIIYSHYVSCFTGRAVAVELKLSRAAYS